MICLIYMTDLFKYDWLIMIYMTDHDIYDLSCLMIDMTDHDVYDWSLFIIWLIMIYYMSDHDIYVWSLYIHHDTYDSSRYRYLPHLFEQSTLLLFSSFAIFTQLINRFSAPRLIFSCSCTRSVNNWIYIIYN